MAAISYGIADIPTKRAIESLQRQLDALKETIKKVEAAIARLKG